MARSKKMTSAARSAAAFEMVQISIGDHHRRILDLFKTDDPAKMPEALCAGDITRRLHNPHSAVRQNWAARVVELVLSGMLAEHHQGRDHVTGRTVAFYLPSGLTEPRPYAKNRSWKTRALEAEKTVGNYQRAVRHLIALCKHHGLDIMERIS